MRRSRLFLVVLAALAAVLGLLAPAAACGSHAAAPSGFAGFWQMAGSSSGGLRIDKLGQDYYLTIVGGDGSMGTPKRATLQNGALYSGPGTAASPGTGPGAWFLVSGDPGSGNLRLTVGVALGASQDFQLERSTSTVAASPNPFVSPPGYSPPPTPAALADGSLKNAKDRQVAENLYAIQTAVEKYIAYQHAIPDASEVTLVGIISNFLDPWVVNPYTSAGGPMIVAKHPGDFSYARHGKTYTLTAYLGDGSTFVISGPPR